MAKMKEIANVLPIEKPFALVTPFPGRNASGDTLRPATLRYNSKSRPEYTDEWVTVMRDMLWRVTKKVQNPCWGCLLAVSAQTLARIFRTTGKVVAPSHFLHWECG